MEEPSRTAPQEQKAGRPKQQEDTPPPEVKQQQGVDTQQGQPRTKGAATPQPGARTRKPHQEDPPQPAVEQQLGQEQQLEQEQQVCRSKPQLENRYRGNKKQTLEQSQEASAPQAQKAQKDE